MIFAFAHGQNELIEIPTKVKLKADSIIKSTLGADYFTKTLFNCEESMIYLIDHLVLNACPNNRIKKRQKIVKKTQRIINPIFYVLKYRLTLKGNSTYDFEIRVDDNLQLKNNPKLPDCINFKTCDIIVDSIMAIDIAIKSGLEKGLGIVNDGLIYDTETESFQWIIKNHLNQDPDKGDIIYIDATTGHRIFEKDRQWKRSVLQ